MPIYEYRCTACEFQQEYLQKLSDAPLTDCPDCGKSSFRKMVTAAGFQLKGSGWYATDFKHGSKPKSKSEDKSTTTSEDKSATKSEDKPAPEATAKKSDAAASTAKSGTGASPA